MREFKPGSKSPSVRWTAVMALATALVACGGGGGSASGGTVAVAPTPSPTPSPSPSPTPTPPPTPGPTVTAITAPALAFAPAVPSSPQASAGGPTFATQPTASITFPVLQSTLALSNGVLAADTGTMNAGSSFDFAYCSGCRETFALNVPSLGLSGVSLNTYADTPFFATLGDGREVRVEEATWGAGGFTSLKYGYWQIGAGFPSNYSAYVYGYETPGSMLPSSGAAKYSGGVLGRVFLMTATGAIAGYVGGLATVEVDFGARTVVGYLTRVRYSDGVGDHEPWNDISFTATLAPGSNRITGTAAAYSSSGSSGSLTSTATGTVAARFYGPGASEMGFVWTLSDGAKAAVGAGAAKG